MTPEERYRIVAEGIGRGDSFAAIAATLGISRQRVGQIARNRGYGAAHRSQWERRTKHGTFYSYQTLRCRCDRCRAAKAEDRRKYR